MIRCLIGISALLTSVSVQAAGEKAKAPGLLPAPTRADVPYKKGGSSRTVLDFYQAPQPGARPTLIFLHGGGWRGSKAGRDKWLQPFLARGWNVANVEYRVPPHDRAPAALIDARCAIAWIRMHSKELRVDPSKLVISGSSAGGQLALMASLSHLPDEFRCEQEGRSSEPPVAGAVIWWGIVDMKGATTRTPPLISARRWIGGRPDFEAMMAKLSPMENIARGMPPTILVQGERDHTAPLEDAVKFNRKLKAASVPSDLIVVPGGKHGGFSDERMQALFGDIFAFFTKRGIG